MCNSIQIHSWFEYFCKIKVVASMPCKIVIFKFHTSVHSDISPIMFTRYGLYIEANVRIIARMVKNKMKLTSNKYKLQQLL